LLKFIGRGRLFQPLELLVISGAALGLAFLFNQFDAFDSMVSFLERHEKYELDEYVFVLFFAGVGAIVLAVRRARDMAREMKGREAAEASALALARHDPLTGLSNRRVLHEELPAMLGHAEHGGRQCSIFVIDLDLFKPVNDLHGHGIGDAVLVEVAARLQRANSGVSLIARIGGDEFVAVMTHEPGTDAPTRAAMRIIQELGQYYQIGEQRVEIGATIGISRCPLDATQADDLLRCADIAMYDAKRAGKGTFRFFHADMDERLRSRAALQAELRSALGRGEILPYFQPVIALDDDRIIGFEALARWEHPVRGTIAPDEFIPIAEDIGLIDEVTNIVLREGCIAARDWPAGTSLSVNISPLQLKDGWLTARLLGILTENGLSPSRLIVEVTENAIIDDIEQAAEVFGSLQNAGIRIALDDFGKGYSSLSHLRQLKFNHLKIDSSFVRSMDCEESQKIVSAVAGLGKSLGMPVTAEGVETAKVAEVLRLLGCEQAQGYLFGRPVPAEDAALLFGGRAAKVTPIRVRKLR
jgi:diguanylate cyclase (GGDEF)-like protein